MVRINLMICLLVIVTSLPMAEASAALTWTWDFNGTEAGTFDTDGTLADATSATPGSPFTFTMDGSTFDVTASSLAANVGANYFDPLPASGFIWDGSGPTQFYRNSDTGTSINVRMARVDDPSVIYGLDVGSFALTDSGFSTVLIQGPGTIAPVPEPASLALLGLGGLAMLMRRRR